MRKSRDSSKQRLPRSGREAYPQLESGRSGARPAGLHSPGGPGPACLRSFGSHQGSGKRQRKSLAGRDDPGSSGERASSSSPGGGDRKTGEGKRRNSKGRRKNIGQV